MTRPYAMNPAHAKTRILVVDDDQRVREAIREMLELDGYEVAEAHNGIEALQICRAKAPALVICDMFMPGKDGIETIQDLKRDFSAVKILAVSGGTSSGKVYLLDVARHLGATRILKKPFGRNALLQNVRELLGESGHRG